MSEAEDALDLLSIKQTSVRCAYGAPLVALVIGRKAFLSQACCNHWECPRCGQIRASQEYRRMVWGAEVLADDHKLYFWTLTCRGRELSLEDAEENYYVWTNRLLTNARARAKRKNQHWAYVQVTERQHKTRAHPHSHILTTFLPDDAVETVNGNDKHTFISRWFTSANESAGLGAQCRISAVASAAAVSRYIAKYLFKDTMRDIWPDHWRRIRYSHNWPKLPEKAPDFVAVLRTPRDWYQAADARYEFVVDDAVDYEIAKHHMANIRLRASDVPM